MPDNPQLTPERMIANLRELQAVTGDSAGAQRLAWTDAWDWARIWLREQLTELPVDVSVDYAGNIWATLPGKSPRSLILGSHIDSVPDGGWLDGPLGVLAGLEVLRRFTAQAAKQGAPAVTVRLVAWAEEEGTQFGKSLFTSTLATGGYDPDELAQVTDRDGNSLLDVIGNRGVHPDRHTGPVEQLAGAGAYLELHIEQGPVLERLGLALAAVTGALGVQRHAIRFTGQSSHAGSTPMDMRRDALAAAARLALEIREIAVRHAGVCTMGSVVTRPGIATAVAGQCDCTLDQRHDDAAALAAMLRDARAASERIAAEERVEVEWRRLYEIEPVSFSPELVDLAAEAAGEISGTPYRMPSGPLHDAVRMRQAGIPAAMMFVQSLGGLSHTKEEDTKDADLLLAVRAFDRLADKAVAWLVDRER